jgi:hypothetical protein
LPIPKPSGVFDLSRVITTPPRDNLKHVDYSALAFDLPEEEED